MAVQWRVADSLIKLRQEVDSKYPNRDKRSDGTIGDADHASRNSDHNPWVDDPTSPKNVVTAIDITDWKDEVGQYILDTILRTKDKRVKYVIFNRKIYSSYATKTHKPWAARPYNGPNAHEKHIHISVHPYKSLYDSVVSWGIEGKPVPEYNDPENMEQCLGQIKDILGIRVGQTWDKADFIRVRDKVQQLVEANR